MAIEKEINKVYLTKETASNFMDRLKRNNEEVKTKRNNFIRISKENIRVENTKGGSMIFVNNKH